MNTSNLTPAEKFLENLKTAKLNLSYPYGRHPSTVIDFAGAKTPADISNFIFHYMKVLERGIYETEDGRTFTFPLTFYRISYADGKVVETNMAAGVTPEMAKAYFYDAVKVEKLA